MSIPTNTTVTVQRQSTPQGVWATVFTSRAWVERTRYNEPQMDGDTEAQDFLLLFPGSVDVLDGDRVVWNGRDFEVANSGYGHTPPFSGVHHTETRMRPGLAYLREMYLATLLDACVIERATESTFDPNTGEITPGAATTVYTGACLVRPRDAYNRETQVVDDTTTLQSYNAFLPHDLNTVEVDDVLTVTASTDARLVGRGLRVTGVRMSSDLAGRVLSLEDDLG